MIDPIKDIDIQRRYPTVIFYDQDLVDTYTRSWEYIQESQFQGTERNGLQPCYFNFPGNRTINQFESIMSTFFLVYHNRFYPADAQLDNFYDLQDKSGAIRCDYSIEDGSPVLSSDNPEGVGPPLFSWAEFNLYHKMGDKKRLREVMNNLEKYWDWLEVTFKQDNGLYAVPLAATGMLNSPRDGMFYPIDFNSQQAVNALYMSELGDILNDKEVGFRYKRHFFALKTRINSLMWDDDAGIYYDLDRHEQRIEVKTIASFWPLLAGLLNEAKFDKLSAHLRNPKTFGTKNIFPTLAADEPDFNESGNGYRGSIITPYTFAIIKGFEKYMAFDLAREYSIRHLYCIVDTLKPENIQQGGIWEAYCPSREGAADWPENPDFPRPRFVNYCALASITLMIENIIGLSISLPRKTVHWIVPTLEKMGIKELMLRRNKISIVSNKTTRGWEVNLESEKLYYFTFDQIGKKKVTLPIPSGRCSMLIDKM